MEISEIKDNKKETKESIVNNERKNRQFWQYSPEILNYYTYVL